MTGSGDGKPRRFTTSSDDLPAEADECARRRHWEETDPYGGAVDFSFGTPYSWRLDMVRFGPVVVDRFKGGGVVRGTRTSRQIAADGRDDFLIGMNRGGPVWIRGRGRREIVQPPGSTTLLSWAEPAGMETCGCVLLGAHIPRTRLTDMVRNVEDLTGSTLSPDTPAACHLRRYVGLILSPGGVPHGDSQLDEHVATTLTDLMALALGARRDEAELAGLRGLRAARLVLAMAEIRRGFADPGLSVDAVAAQLFVAPRTLQDLLHDAGASFTERVLELRLQKARRMLASPEARHAQVARIAHACGFRDISYFNRCFRRRFGASPRDLRT